MAGSATRVVAAGKLLVAGLDSDGITVSLDQGRRWRSANSGLPAGSTIADLIYDPTGNRLLGLAGTGGVFVTAARLPLRWHHWGGPLPAHLNPLTLAYWPQGRMVLIGDGSGAVYRAGESGPWNAADTNLPVNQEAVTRLLRSGQRLYAGLSGGLWSSTDAAHWTPDQQFGSAEVFDITDLPRNGLAIAGGSSGLYLRTAGADTWRVVGLGSLGLPADERVIALAFAAHSARICLGTIAGGITCVRLDGTDPRRLAGVPARDPVNGMLITQDVLIAATNSGPLRLPVPRW